MVQWSRQVRDWYRQEVIDVIPYEWRWTGTDRVRITPGAYCHGFSRSVDVRWSIYHYHICMDYDSDLERVSIINRIWFFRTICPTWAPLFGAFFLIIQNVFSNPHNTVPARYPSSRGNHDCHWPWPAVPSWYQSVQWSIVGEQLGLKVWAHSREQCSQEVFLSRAVGMRL